jgi:hypothetical protein
MARVKDLRDSIDFCMKGLFITFEGNEGSGKSTQISLLAERLRSLGYAVRTLREPGGTPIGEEIRHTLKHSLANEAMTPEAELLLMNASRAQLVREVIRPALAGGDIVLCDRFFDSTTAYQGYGRRLDLSLVKSIVDFAVGDTRPDLVSRHGRIRAAAVAPDRCHRESFRAHGHNLENRGTPLAQSPETGNLNSKQLR